MICDKKKLAAALGKAIKTGYELCVDGNEIHIITQDWRFSGSLDEVGNELLASIVLQLGFLPRACCLCVAEVKADGEKTIQMQELMPDVFFTKLAGWGAETGLEKCVFTALKLGSAWLYQLPDGRILGANVTPSLLAQSGHVGTAAGEGAVGWMDYNSQIWFRAVRPAEESELRQKWKALESVTWSEVEA